MSRNSTILNPRPPMNNLFFDSSSDEEEEDEETRLQREEEEEQERLLSKQFGEAQESSAPKRKSGDETNIEDEYSSRKKARKRPTLTPAMVTSAKGLVRIRHEFPRSVKWPTTCTQNNTQAAAMYSRTLINSYKSFCYDLFPNNAFEDVLTRIETFGSKKEVREYLQHLRMEIRNAHVEKLYGKTKAEAMIAELQQGMQHDEFGAMDSVVQEETEDGRDYELRARDPSKSGEETSGGINGENTTTETAPSSNVQATSASTLTGETTANAPTTNVAAPSTNTNHDSRPPVQDDLQDSDDELEFVVSTKPKPVNPFAEDDDDDESEDEEMANDNKTTVATLDNRTNTAESTTAGNDETEEMDLDKTNETEPPTAPVAAADIGDSNQDKEESSPDVEMATPDDQENETNKDEAPTPEKEAESPKEDTILASEQSPAAQDSQGSPTIDDPPQGQETPSSSDETATIVATMTESQIDCINTQDLTMDSQYVSTLPLAQPTDANDKAQEEEMPSSSDETATIVPTMSTTQMESPGDNKTSAEVSEEANASQEETEGQLMEASTEG